MKRLELIKRGYTPFSGTLEKNYSETYDFKNV